jgi:hypothetical protein
MTALIELDIINNENHKKFIDKYIYQLRDQIIKFLEKDKFNWGSYKERVFHKYDIYFSAKNESITIDLNSLIRFKITVKKEATRKIKSFFTEKTEKYISTKKINFHPFQREDEFLQKLKGKADDIIGITVKEFNDYLKNKELYLDENEYISFEKLIKHINNFIKKSLEEIETENIEFKTSMPKILSELDKDGNGKLDTIEVEDEFLKLLQKYQTKIIEVDKSYIQQFIKVSDYQKTQRDNLQTIFENISKTKDNEELKEVVSLLNEQIHSYESLLFHSFNMITSLVNDDLVTFYQIHNSFDKLNIFNSNHQNDLMEKLTNIEDGLYNLISSIRQMERKIISRLNNLSYITESSYENLSISVNENLKAIGSSINTNNLLTAINTYQNYSTNRRLNS